MTRRTRPAAGGLRLLAGALGCWPSAACAERRTARHARPAGPRGADDPRPRGPGVRHRRRGVRARQVGVLVPRRAKFRKRKDDDGSLPPQVHGNIKLEIGWTILPGASLLAVVGAASVLTLLDLDETARPTPCRCTVIGQQWWWEYRYDVDGDGKDDIVTANDLVIPAGEPIALTITSRDVIHSFWIPALNGKQDAVPGRVAPAHDRGRRARRLPRAVHRVLRPVARLHAHARGRRSSEADYEAWVANQLEGAKVPTASWPRQGMELFRTTCSQCHLVAGEGGNEEARDEAGIDGAALVSRRGARTSPTSPAAACSPAPSSTSGSTTTATARSTSTRSGRAAQRRRPRRRGCATRRPRSRWTPQGSAGHAQPRPHRRADRCPRRLPRDAGVAVAMAIVERPTDVLALPSGGAVARTTRWACSPARGPRRAGGRGSARSTTRRSASCTAPSSLFFFVIGGVEALLIRSQLAAPGQKLLSADLYNQVFTMHGITMIFLVVMPMGAAFMNYLIPLQIGARDVAFPRLNALSFWTFLFGGIFLNTSWFLGGGADGGWFAYAPNTGVIFSPSHGMDFYAIGLQITGIASLVGGVNLVVTVLNMRAPGMTLMKMPVFTWMSLVAQVLLVFAIPVISVALFLLTFDRLFDANFFNVEPGRRPAAVGAPVLDLRAPGGLHPDPAGLRHRVRDHPGVLAQADLRLPVHGVLGHRDRLHGLGRVGAPHVRLRPRADLGGRLLGVDDVHRGAHRREDPQLDGHHVGREDHLHHAAAVLDRPGRDVHHRRPVRRHPRGRPGRHPADRHLLHRRPLPLRDLRRRAVRLPRRLLLLVAEGVRLLPGREARASRTSGSRSSASTSRSGRCTSSACRA